MSRSNLIKSSIVFGSVSLMAFLSSAQAHEIEPEQSAAQLPRGAIVAFDRDSCPRNWDVYAPAAGRFLRGLDVFGTGIDPDPNRRAGDIQKDAIRQHTHSIKSVKSAAHNPQSGGSQGYGSGPYGHNIGATNGVQSSAGLVAEETRPVNVAVLFCRKR